MMEKLKTWPEPFQAMVEDQKLFEFRKNDRENGGFVTGDELLLQEWDHGSQKYTGRELRVEITYTVEGPLFGIPKGYIVMSIKKAKP